MKHVFSTLLNKAFFEVYSTTTKDVYIDEDRMCHIFVSEKEGMNFVEHHENTTLVCLDDIKETLIISYDAGARGVRVYVNGNEIDSGIRINTLDKNFHNTSTNAYVNLFKETNNSNFLKKAAEGFFIVPVRVRDGNKGYIVYATMHKNNDPEDFAYVAFTDLQRFYVWADQETNWSPLMINVDIMAQIAGDKSFVVNPMKGGFILSSKMLEKLKKYSCKEDWC